MTAPTDPRVVELVRLLRIVDACTRRQAGRLRGAAQNADWRRLVAWRPVDMRVEDIAALSGVPAAQVAAGLAGVTERRATA